MSPILEKQNRSSRFLTILFGISIFTVCFFSGCGDTNPVIELRSQGAIINYNDKRKSEIESVKMPEDAENDALVYFKHERLSTLKTLDLSGTKITDEGLEQLESLSSLEELKLDNTSIGDTGMEYVAKIPNLKRLFIGDTKVSDAGLKQLESSGTLEFLSLEGKPEPKQPLKRSWATAFRLGIDLAGGTNLVYQVLPTADKKVTSDVMQQMVTAVGHRINPSGTEEIVVRQVGLDRIEVIIPKADPETVRRKKAQMTRLGSLEFALLANRRDHRDLIDAALKLGPREEDLKIDGDLVAGWREVALKSDDSGESKKVGEHGDVVTRDSVTNPGVKEFLVVFDPDPSQRVTGKYLDNVHQSTDRNNFQLAVGFELNVRGGVLFFDLTSTNAPKADGFESRLAILLDNKIHSAPGINEPISGSGIIRGDFTKKEIDELIKVLNAGALVLPLDPTPISEQTIDPLIGSDSQTKGKNAIMLASVIVVLFMMVYYMFAGVVADLCLLFNLVLIMGSMSFIDAAFTLPGLAGIVLTIGMAVDANVLIFERMREETRKGSSLRMAIQNGFGRAFSAIVDANVTTLIVAVILYIIGTDQVRGFAVTLFIGIVMSMFTALYFGRVLFDICERKNLLTNLKMNSLVGETHWNFVSKRRIAVMLSFVFIIGGLVAVAVRGSDMLDIDFTGGSMVTIEFEEPQDANEILGILRNSDILGDNLTLERLRLSEDEVGEKVRRFRVRTKYTKSDTETNSDTQGEGIDRKKNEGAMKDIKDEIKRLLANASTDGKNFKLKQIAMTYDPNAIESIKNPSTKKSKKTSNQTREMIDSTFYDGHRVKLSLSGDGLKSTTIEDYFVRITEKRGGSSKYGNIDELFFVDGKANGKNSENDASPLFTEVTINAKKEIPKEDFLAVLSEVKKDMAENPIFAEVNSFESSVAKDMQRSAILAMLFSLVAIVAYIWLRFQKATFGLAAVAALVHDVLVVLGLVAIWGLLGWGDFKINLPMIAAFLTIVGYSLNDTIVVFDRIREVRGKNPALTEGMVDTSLNQTLSRTLLTSLTTFMVVLILFIGGGEGIEGFAFCLVMGVIVGTYSSIYIASPVLIWLMNRPGSETARASSFSSKAVTT